MTTVWSFSPDKETAEIVEKLTEQRGVNRSKVIRDAIQFYSKYRLDKETTERIEKLCALTKLKPAQVVAYAIGILEDIMKRGE